MFKLKDGRIFRKEEKLRKRYKCVEVSSRRVYLFSPVAEVEHIEQKTWYISIGLRDLP